MKRGAVRTVVVLIILTLIGAGILFLFLYYPPHKEMAELHACRNSVILRSKEIAALEPLKLLIPLKCKTRHIKIDSPKEETIKREIAEAMYDCWWMLGEGKLDFFQEEVLKEMGMVPAKSLCMICSTIKFEGKARDKKIDLFTYLDSTKIPRKNITYYEYFLEAGERMPTGVDVMPIDTNQDYAILFFYFESEPLWKGIAWDAGLAVATLGGSFIIKAAKGGIRAAWTSGSLVKRLFGVKVRKGLRALEESVDPEGIVMKGAGVYTIPATIGALIGQAGMLAADQFTAMGRCDGAKQGCFKLVLIPYEAEQLAEACGTIESIP